MKTILGSGMTTFGRAAAALVLGGLLASACGDFEAPSAGNDSSSPTATTAPLSAPNLHGFKIGAGGDVTFSVNAYGGAADGGPLKLYQYCPSNNSDCTWTYRNGTILSDTNPSIGIRSSESPIDGEYLFQSARCGGSSPPASCKWVYHDGRFYSVASGQNLAIYAQGGAATGSDLVLKRNCFNGKSANCHWVIQSAMISTVASADGLMYNAWGGARDGIDVKLANGCSRDNPDCTWTFTNGMIVSDRNPALALNAYGGAGVGAPLKLSAACDASNPDCRWRLDGGVLYSDTSSLALISTSQANGATISLQSSCTSNNCRVGMDIGAACGLAGLEACGGTTCNTGRLSPLDGYCHSADFFQYSLTANGHLYQPAGLYDDVTMDTIYNVMSAWRDDPGVNGARWNIIFRGIMEVENGLCGDQARQRYNAASGAEWCSEFAKSVFYFASNAFYPAPAIHDIRACKSSFLGSCLSYEYLFRDANTVNDMLTIFQANGGRVAHSSIPSNPPVPGDYLAMNGGGGPETHSGVIIALSDDLRHVWTAEGNVNDCVAFQEHDWIVNGSLDGNMNETGNISVAY